MVVGVATLGVVYKGHLQKVPVFLLLSPCRRLSACVVAYPTHLPWAFIIMQHNLTLAL